jgi:archaellum component FlaF (FlaF/FlaG flagellin family)
MKKVILLLFFTNILFAQSAGFLNVNTPQNLTVAINDSIVGETPLNFKLLPGIYTIRVFNPKLSSWIENNFSKTVNINANETTEIDVNFYNNIIINSEPFDADIFYNGKLVGKTPYIFPGDLYGNVVLKKNGYEDYFIDLNVAKNYYFNVKLLEKPETVKPQFLPYENKLTNKRKNFAYGSLAVTVLSGSLSAYIRTKADKEYDKYLTTEKEEYYNKANQIDMYSNITLGVAQISLALFIYLMMKE